MRVISGRCKGRKLKAHKSMITRPTTDKVKESLFNIIGPNLSGERVLDLFAGSGALGIEALSRGASTALFVEKNFSVSRILHENIAFCKLGGQAEVLVMNAKQAIDRLSTNGMQPFDLVFIDPPYKMAQDVIELIETMCANNLLSEEALVIVEHDGKVTMPDCIAALEQFRQEKYGETRITFYG